MRIPIEPLPADSALNPATSDQPGSPIRVIPPHPTTDNLSPKLKLPANAKVKVQAQSVKPVAKTKEPGDIDPDDLEARFAALGKW